MATVKGPPAEFRRKIEEGNRLPEIKLDTLDKLATPTSDSEGCRAIQSEDDHNTRIRKRLWFAVQAIRGRLAAGDIRWAIHHAIGAGVLAHELGWSERDAEAGEKVRDGGKKGSEKTYGDSESKRARWLQHQVCLEAVAREHPDWDRESAQKETARRRGCKLRTIQRRTTWPDN